MTGVFDAEPNYVGQTASLVPQDVTSTASAAPAKRTAPAPGSLDTALATSADMWGQGSAPSNSACVRLHNYWCIKTPYDAYWDGQVGRDEREHAIFKHPAYGARAFARLMRAYYFKHGRQTPKDIIARYAPANDCTGYFNQHCPNKVSRYAAAVADGLGISPESQIDLFYADGRMKYETAVLLFQTFAKYEIGGSFIVPEALIRKGIEMEQDDYTKEHGSLLAGPMAANLTAQNSDVSASVGNTQVSSAAAAVITPVASGQSVDF